MFAMLVTLSGLTIGAWNVSFDEPTATLSLSNTQQNVSLEGKLSFSTSMPNWRVANAREAAVERLSLVDGGNTVRGYISFRGEGNTLTMEAFHRAGGNNFYAGNLQMDGVVHFRPESFACRTLASDDERVLNFADGAGDSPLNDSLFAREEDLALRFHSQGTHLKSLGKGDYSFSLCCCVEYAAHSSLTVELAPRYYASRWAPGYHPIDRTRCPKAPTGWMSWNTYFDKAGAKENLEEARIAKQFLQPFGLEIWSIESWQDNSCWLPVSNFHNLDLSCYTNQFPEGMKKLADDIRALGYRPGLWMPLYGTGDEKFYQEHKEWFLHDRDGKPINNWNGRFMLDTTIPEVLDHLRSITRTASKEWGYEFFKFDGMANTPRKFEKPEIRACAKNPKDVNWFENSVKALREGIGEDRLFLGCMGDFTGTEAKYLDASRLGADVVGCYHGLGERTVDGFTSKFAQMPVTWGNILHQADCTFSQIFVNNLMFYTDPDTLLVNYVLEKNEVDVMATIIGLPGQLMFAGDKLAELQMDRMKVIQQVLPVADIHPVNLYPYFSRLPIWNLTVTRPFGTWHSVAVFNFENSEREIAFDLHEIGLDDDKTYTAFEFWRQEWIGSVQEGLDLTIPARTVRLIALWEQTDHPQFVGDDRHLTQGAVELNDLSWDQNTKTFSVNVTAVGGFPLSMTFRVPEGFSLREARAPKSMEDVKVTTNFQGKELLTLTVTSPQTRKVPVLLKF
ncbi:MAG: alpha-galactosidase [Kiritimatiellae bacterium]|nr:alpha-galactosidase [Kiritimatiellia bacterium]